MTIAQMKYEKQIHHVTKLRRTRNETQAPIGAWPRIGWSNICQNEVGLPEGPADTPRGDSNDVSTPIELGMQE